MSLFLQLHLPSHKRRDLISFTSHTACRKPLQAKAGLIKVFLPNKHGEQESMAMHEPRKPSKDLACESPCFNGCVGGHVVKFSGISY